MKKGIYRHFKGEIVQVLDIAHHSETLEDMVVYRALSDCRDFGKGSLWVRPKEMFLEEVEVDGGKKPRFEFLEERKGFLHKRRNNGKSCL